MNQNQRQKEPKANEETLKIPEKHCFKCEHYFGNGSWSQSFCMVRGEYDKIVYPRDYCNLYKEEAVFADDELTKWIFDHYEECLNEFKERFIEDNLPVKIDKKHKVTVEGEILLLDDLDPVTGTRLYKEEKS